MKYRSKKRAPNIVNLTVMRRYLTQREIERLMDCARATSGHVAAAPPSSVMNWRRFRSGMGSSPEPAVPA